MTSSNYLCNIRSPTTVNSFFQKLFRDVVDLEQATRRTFFGTNFRTNRRYRIFLSYVSPSRTSSSSYMPSPQPATISDSSQPEQIKGLPTGH